MDGHHPHFVSCEDQLPQLLGVFNYACSISSIALLLLQLRPVSKMVQQYRPLLDADAMMFLSALILLFYLNLHQHMTGYIQIDVDSGGCLYSMTLSLWLNNSLRSKSHVPCILARRFVIGAAFILLATCIWAPSQQSSVTKMFDPPFAVYTILTMGLRSYKSKDKMQDWRFVYWCGAFLSFVLVQLFVVLEKTYICDTAAARLFHALVIHATIAFLFECVFACAIRIIACESNAPDTLDEKKES